MAKKATTTSQPAPAEDPAANNPDPTNSDQPTPNSSPLDEAQANPNAATGDDSDNTNQDNPPTDDVNEAPAAPDTSDPDVQGSQPDEAPEDTTTSPTTEAHLTHGEVDPTKTVKAGSADATADHTADGPSNGTRNTHPQSPLHDGDVDEMTKTDIIDEMQEPGAVVGNVAAKYGVTPERVFEIIDEGAAERAEAA